VGIVSPGKGSLQPRPARSGSRPGGLSRRPARGFLWRSRLGFGPHNDLHSFWDQRHADVREHRTVDHLYLALMGLDDSIHHTVPDAGLAPSIEATIGPRHGTPARKTQKILFTPRRSFGNSGAMTPDVCQLELARKELGARPSSSFDSHFYSGSRHSIRRASRSRGSRFLSPRRGLAWRFTSKFCVHLLARPFGCECHSISTVPSG
jgi:hypothetical protein